MKLENFVAGSFQQQYQYKSFQPTPVDLEWTWDDASINTLLEEASRALSGLNAFSFVVPDIDLFITMHVLKEAQKSSRIEGTQTEMQEAILSEEQVTPEKRDDWREVHNYVDALNDAIKSLSDLPLSSRLLRDAHQTLMRGVRGEHKQPGEFRISQNWIGGSSLSDAVFIPPHPHSVPDLMSDLERFWHNDTVHVPHIIRAAISHYQFETIHPFLDGNGRIGRLLITLYLVSHGLLNKPSLYLSDFFERNRNSYYDALMRARLNNDLTHWIKFFLSGTIETANKGISVFQQILALRHETEQAVLNLGRRAGTAGQVIRFLYKKPAVTAADIEKELNISSPTANTLIRELQGINILNEVTGNQRGRLYVFEKYVSLYWG